MKCTLVLERSGRLNFESLGIYMIGWWLVKKIFSLEHLHNSDVSVSKSSLL
jgi:hypothetical protein